MLDATSGGALVDKTPMEARNLIANMATNLQQFGDRHDWPNRRVNEVGVNSEIQQQLATLTSLVKTMTMRDNQSRLCGVCSMVGHMSDMCSNLNEGIDYEQVNALGEYQGQQNFQGAPRYRNEPYWLNHPNFSYANNPNQTAHDFRAQRPYLAPHDFNQPRQNINYPPPKPIPPP